MVIIKHLPVRKTKPILHPPITNVQRNPLLTLAGTTAVRKGLPPLPGRRILHLPVRQKVRHLPEVTTATHHPAAQVITQALHEAAAEVLPPAVQEETPALPEVAEVLHQVVLDTGDNSVSETLIALSTKPAYQIR